ncbi:MAG: Yip1 family protein [Maritimibacter sp.]
MRIEPGYLLGMVMQTIAEPRKVARELFDLQIERGALWMILILVLTLSSGLSVLIGTFFPPDPAFDGTIFANPFMTSIAEASLGIIGVFLVFWVGRMTGGTGRFEDAIMTLAWMEFVLLMFAMITILVMLFAPAIGLLLWVMGTVTSFWVLSHFTAEMHGFKSALSVFFGIVLTCFVILLVVSVMLTLAGVGAGALSGMEGLEG